MNLSLIGKFGLIFKYIFSSFLSLETFIISLLLLVILILNQRKNNFITQLVAVSIFLGFIIGIFISYTTYVKTCFDSFVKAVMSYIYFPSTIAYFFIMLFVTLMVLYTLASSKLSNFKKIFNYSFFCTLYFLFMGFLSLSAYDMVDLLDIAALYKNDTILSFVQVSNLLLVIWLLFTGFYHLYLFFKKKYD